MSFLKYVKNFQHLKIALYVAGSVAITTSATAWRLHAWSIKKERAEMIQEMNDNMREVNLDQTLLNLDAGQDSIWMAVTRLGGKFEEYKEQSNEDYSALTAAVSRVEENLSFYVENADSLSVNQMLKVFEMGREDEKKNSKRTVSTRSLPGNEFLTWSMK